VSVVIVSRGDTADLEACMNRLSGPCRRFDAEILVVAPLPEAEVAALRKRFPGARIIAAPADLGESDLRALGIMEAGGDIVAFTEDCDLRGEEWIGVLERRARANRDYGPLPNGAVDWPAYLEGLGVISRNGDSRA
jgi:GT2 family glycosyltransferase